MLALRIWNLIIIYNMRALTLYLVDMVLTITPKQVIRKTVKTRYGVRHQNVIDLLGIDSTFTPHAGLVLEYCARGNLTVVCSLFK